MDILYLRFEAACGYIQNCDYNPGSYTHAHAQSPIFAMAFNYSTIITDFY